MKTLSESVETLRSVVKELGDLPDLLDSDNIADVAFKLGQFMEVIARVASDLEEK